MSVNISDVLDIVNNQNQWRGKEAINLIASENVQSDAVKQIESNDFMGRYAEGHPNTAQEDSRYYEGTRYIDQIESMTTREIIQLAKCLQADVHPLSGNAANTAVALSILRVVILWMNIISKSEDISAITLLAWWEEELRFEEK